MPSPTVHNALIELCNKSTVDRSALLDMSLEIMKKIEEFSVTFPTAGPNEETWAQVLKTCSYTRGDEAMLEKALTTANDIFAKLEDNQTQLKMTDKCYFHMMKCVVNLTPDEDESHKRLVQLFSDAGEKGFVSANVLRVFKNNVSDEEFEKTVGEGRLADKWVANVTSGKALYTDGTMGGAGKHAFRKGKSTSGWAKKQRRRVEEIVQRKEAKSKRKMQRRKKQ
uniref:Uncharacterized protein n=1 Tax=Ditylum brightwellii TaxID=49249 RepID=A0A7S4SN70_9STRA